LRWDGVRVVRVQNGTTTRYVGEFYEVDPVSRPATVYYPSNGQAVAMRRGADSLVYYLHRDQVGSVTSVSNTSSSQVSWFKFWTYGAGRISGRHSGVEGRDERRFGCN